MFKISQTFNLSTFETQVPEKDYGNYFTIDEISQYSKKRSKGSLAVRYLLKKIIIEHFEQSINYTDLEVLNSPTGKPELSFRKPLNKSERILFSLSHTKSTVAVLVVFE